MNLCTTSWTRTTSSFGEDGSGSSDCGRRHSGTNREFLFAGILECAIRRQDDRCRPHALMGHVHARRRGVLLDELPSRPQQPVARHDDTVIGGDQVLLRAIDDRAHAFLQRTVLDRDSLDPAVGVAAPLRLAIHQIIVVLVGEGAIGAWHVAAMHALAIVHGSALGVGDAARGMIIVTPGPAVLVVDGYPEMPVHGVPTARRDHGEGRQHPLGDAPVVVAILGIAPRTDVKTAGTLDHLEHRLRIAEVVLIAFGALEQRIGADIGAVQKGDMAGVDAPLHRLQPVALLQPLGHEPLLARDQRELPLGQRRPPFRRSHVGPQHPATLDQRVRPDFDLLGEATLLGLGGNLHALPGHVELPAVIGATQPALLVTAEPQRCAAVRTKLVDQTIASAGVPKSDQALRKHLHSHWRAVVRGQLLGEQDRRPVATKQPTHGRARTGLRKQIVLLLPKHAPLPWRPCK